MSPPQAALTPLKSLRVTIYQIPAFERFPNSSILKKPLLIYHSVFLPTDAKISPSIIEKHLQTINVVDPQWRYTMDSTSHFHSTTHEVLCVSSGRARLCFGVEENPKRAEVEAGVGDVMVIPAGVAHRLLEDIQGGFEMVGSYPRGGKMWDLCFGKEGEEDKVKGIGELGWFERDPVYGNEGPVLGV